MGGSSYENYSDEINDEYYHNNYASKYDDE